MNSINEIFRDIVTNTSKEYGKNVSYMFGDWEYIAGELTKWSESQKTSKLKFPIICLYSPYMEDRTKNNPAASLDFLILVNTSKEYINEDREKISFEKVLRPIYNIFIKKIGTCPFLEKNYNNIVPHQYTENYRYGRKGVETKDVPFKDFIDAIEIKNLSITIKNIKCYGDGI